VDVAGILFKVVTIPIYDTLGDENITYVLKHVEMRTIFVDSGAIKSLKKTKDLDRLKFIISFDPIDTESTNYFEQKGIKLISYSDLLARGK
jgi:long-chain acyl-CoA synthetase